MGSRKHVFRRLALAVSFGMLAATGGVAAPGPVAAAPAPGDQSAQVELVAQLHQLTASKGLRGFAGSALDADGRTVRLYWAGDQPSALRSFASRLRSGVRLSVISVPYDQEEIVARARALIKAAKLRGIPIGAVSSTSDLRGLHADVEPSATAEQRAELRRLGATEISEAGAMVPLARYSDSAPFWGGAVIERPGAVSGSFAHCSTGFAARTSSGTVGMLTAEHCGANRDWTTPTVLGLSSVPVGRSNAGHATTDSMLITGRTYSAFLYRGDWSSGTGRQVTSRSGPSIDQKVCAGGGMSGEVCNATVHRINVIGPNGAGPGYFARTSSSSVPLAGQGDSGGPGFAVAVSNGNITALGIVSSAYLTDRATSCPGGTSNPWNNSVPARECFYNVHFINLTAIEAALGVSVMTSP
ncbi:hypothetical protein [Plantactinospora sp. BB1]|uniref:hypothetical protein n=1 Tax=Plantactinospora sp. BB1 TaxID=2071627 RepID=UPI00131F3FD5|nr:hypothetical protein [Plantactinospora sp. BB1]